MRMVLSGWGLLGFLVIAVADGARIGSGHVLPRLVVQMYQDTTPQIHITVRTVGLHHMMASSWAAAPAI